MVMQSTKWKKKNKNHFSLNIVNLIKTWFSMVLQCLTLQKSELLSTRINDFHWSDDFSVPTTTVGPDRRSFAEILIRFGLWTPSDTNQECLQDSCNESWKFSVDLVIQTNFDCELGNRWIICCVEIIIHSGDDEWLVWWLSDYGVI